MRVLVVDAYRPGDPDAPIVDAAIELVESLGNEVERLQVAGESFAGFMTADEKRAYETDEPLIAPDTHAAAEAIQAADAFLFCYPTTMFGVPPALKSWLERTMVLGVAFVFDDKRRIRPAMTNIRRLGVITTSPHGRVRTWRARDSGHRTLIRSMRLNCHPRCTWSFNRLASGADVDSISELRGLRRLFAA